MSDTAILVHNISKRYRFGLKSERYQTLRDSLAGLANPFRIIRSRWNHIKAKSDPDQHFMALDDVSFEIKRGDVVGVIGRNGAGKSTLLKVLSRITEPTSGFAEIHGRIGSLLEVGTGFHPELTGRENVYLNGAILGMRRREIDKRFDEIVAFSEVEKFIDTPVKHYSSGMNLRLAFAVAAHLEPEILLVDEVLAVGDVAFQRKCIGKMDEVATGGRTVLFVSHNMGTIRSLCNKGLFLDRGRVGMIGKISDCIQSYYKAIGAYQTDKDEASPVEADPRQSGFGSIKINGRVGESLPQDEAATISTSLTLKHAVAGFTIYCLLKDMEGRRIFSLVEDSRNLGFKEFKPGIYQIKAVIPKLWLNPGSYSVQFKSVYSGDYGGPLRHRSDMYPVDVTGTGSKLESLLAPKAEWMAEKLELSDLGGSKHTGEAEPRLVVNRRQ